MENKKLGKGLSSIFGQDVSKILDDIQNGEVETEHQEQKKISIDQIRPNPYQPRKVYDQQALKDFSNSISQHGDHTPVLTRKRIRAYELIAG